jgi:hypothetical protein
VRCCRPVKPTSPRDDRMPSLGRAPLWTRMGFSWATAGAFLVLAGVALYEAGRTAWPAGAQHAGLPMNIGAPVALMTLAMVLVLAALAVPLVIRHKARRRSERRSALR